MAARSIQVCILLYSSSTSVVDASDESYPPDAASAARQSKNPEVYSVLIEFGWDVNEYIGYPGDALM